MDDTISFIIGSLFVGMVGLIIAGVGGYLAKVVMDLTKQVAVLISEVANGKAETDKLWKVIEQLRKHIMNTQSKSQPVLKPINREKDI